MLHSNTHIRHQACLALNHIVNHGRSANEVLPAVEFENPTDTSFFKSMVLSTCRYYIELSSISKRLLTKSLRKKDQDIQCLIILGLYQLKYSRVPSHAAISETVETCNILKKPWATKLVNSVLRRYDREKESLNADLEANWDTKFAMPEWLIRRLKPAYKGVMESVLNESNTQASMTLRVNQRHVSRERYQELLSEEGIGSSPHPFAHSALVLDQAVPVFALPHFQEGWASVQDAAAQLAAQLLAPKNGEVILDACTAPGGKACHLFELEQGIKLTVADIDEKRLARVHENFERLAVDAEIIQADLADSPFADAQFDAILLDAPCSATGVIRRHPDIKLLRNNDDIDALAELQHSILTHLWSKLKPGGRLLYATCSLLAEENSQQVERFLANHSDALYHAFPETDFPQSHSAIGLQLIPNQDQMDGFYYAMLQKNL